MLGSCLGPPHRSPIQSPIGRRVEGLEVGVRGGARGVEPGLRRVGRASRAGNVSGGRSSVLNKFRCALECPRTRLEWGEIAERYVGSP
jgi:hypothetical protein